MYIFSTLVYIASVKFLAAKAPLGPASSEGLYHEDNAPTVKGTIKKIGGVDQSPFTG